MSNLKQSIQICFEQESSLSGQEIESSQENSLSLYHSQQISFTTQEREKQIDEMHTQFQEMSCEYCLYLFGEQQKSNYLKNLIRSFQRFIMNDGDFIVIESLDIYQKNVAQFRQQFKKFIKRRNINNSLVKDLIMNVRFGVVFKYYLEKYAIDWLKQSIKILDIKYHIFYIVFLIRTFSEPKFLDKLKYYLK